MEKTSVKGKVTTKVTGGDGFHTPSYENLLFEIFSLRHPFLKRKGQLPKKVASKSMCA